MALEADTHLRVPHCIVVRAVIVNSDDGQSDIQAVHIRSSLESCVESKGYGPGMIDVGLQGGNPVADHVIGMIASEVVLAHISETVLGHILEPGTEIVDPETAVDCNRLWALVTWNADNPGFDPGSLLFLEAESWACQVAEIVVPVAGK